MRSENKCLLKKKLLEWGFTKKGLLNNQNGEWWLFAQLITILGHIPAALEENIAWPLEIKTCSILLFIFGLYRTIFSLYILGDNLSPLPEPKKSMNLVTERFYKHVRHPIYQSLIIVSLSIVLFKGTLNCFILFIILCLILISKAKREERSLRSLHLNYINYMSATPALFRSIIFFDWRK